MYPKEIQIDGTFEGKTFAIDIDQMPPSPSSRRQNTDVDYQARFNPKLGDSLRSPQGIEPKKTP
jgi:hypothetical protein